MTYLKINQITSPLPSWVARRILRWQSGSGGDFKRERKWQMEGWR
jgi:hypothetical protein